MIIDTSAFIAILSGEPEANQFSELIYDSSTVAASTATVLELALVAGRSRWDAAHALLRHLDVKTVPFDAEQLEVARRAHQEYGRGSGSQARLNFGDCFSYALAKVRDEPLLFQGDDFTHTDIRLCATGYGKTNFS